MKYRVEIEPAATAEIHEAFRWIAEQAPQPAARWYNGLEVCIQALADMPERCPFATENEFFDQEIRQLLHGRKYHRYRVLFTIRGNVVHVLHVRHGARKHLKRELI